MTLAFRVRVAWTTDPFSGSPSWTDESGRVDVGSVQININRGTGDRDQTINPSTLSLTFDNHDGRFTPLYSGSALFPNVVIGKRIRVDSTVDGTNYFNRFDGYLDTLPVQWQPGGFYGEAAITAVDRLKKLSRQLVLDNTISTFVVHDGATDYWTMGDADGTVTPFNRTGTAVLLPDGALSGSTVFGTATGPGTDGLTAAQLTDFEFAATQAQALYTEAVGFTIETFLLLPTTYNLSNSFQFSVELASPTTSVVSHLDTLSTLNFASFFDGNLGTAADGTTNQGDGLTHHLAGVYSPAAGGTVTLYVDGAVQTTHTGAGTGTDAFQLNRIFTNDPTFAATIAHAAIYPTPLTATQIQTHALAGLTGFAGDTSAARFTRIASLAGITPVVTGSFGTQSMSALSGVDGKSILDLLQEVQDTENGAFFTQTDGDLQLVGRTAFYNQVTAAMTFSAGQYTTDLVFQSDDTHLINDAVATSGNGTRVEATNATSITANGTLTPPGGVKTLETTSDGEALNWAQYEVTHSSSDPRVSQVTIDLLSNQGTISLPTFWGLDIGNRIDLSGLPTGAPASTAQLQIVGYSESYSLSSYTVTFNTVPLAGNFWVLGSATLGKLGNTTNLAY